MSDAWEYKEATWSEVRNNPFSYRRVSGFSDKNDEDKLETERKSLPKKQYIVEIRKVKERLPKGPKGGMREVEVTYYSIIEFRNRTNITEDNGGYILDDNGYPINRDKFVTDFPKPPVDMDDVSEQLEKLYSDFYWDFPTWLGHHSREGWEVFKISRNFRSQGKETWCVFRRRV